MDTGGGPFARLYATALAGLVNTPYVKSTGRSVQISLPKSRILPETTLERRIPQWSNALERDRARMYFVAYAAAFNNFEVPHEKAIGCGFHEAVRGVLSHHMVIEKGKIANYHPYPPTPWNGSPRDSFGTPGASYVTTASHLQQQRSEDCQLNLERQQRSRHRPHSYFMDNDDYPANMTYLADSAPALMAISVLWESLHAY